VALKPGLETELVANEAGAQEESLPDSSAEEATV